jgi:hypothetical protein
MKYILILVMLCSLKASSQTIKDTVFDFSKMDMRCGVAHITKDGVFSCDFKGTYYPEHLYDSTVRKWFIKVKDGDSLFYYRHDVERLYIWNGRPKNQEYGYEWETGGGSVAIPDKYNGSDTLRIMEQVWTSKQ